MPRPKGRRTATPASASPETAAPEPVKTPSVDERVRHIVKLMSANKWLRSKDMQRQLSAKWNCDEATVRRYASEAHRVLMLDPEERDALRNQLAERMLKIHEDAWGRQNEMTGLPDYKAAIEALKLYGAYSGVPFEAPPVLAPGSDGKPIRHEVVIIEHPDADDRPAQ